MRSMAAALVGSMLGCGMDHRTEADDDSADAPDGGVKSPTADAPGPGFARCGDEICFDLAEPANAALRNVGGARLVIVEGKRLIVIRTTAEQFNVLSAVCTHAGCSVNYSKARNDVECPCHGSTFALSGAVTHGPAETPLASFNAFYDAASETLTVSA